MSLSLCILCVQVAQALWATGTGELLISHGLRKINDKYLIGFELIFVECVIYSSGAQKNGMKIETQIRKAQIYKYIYNIGLLFCGWFEWIIEVMY